ncbi:hypothetical protein H0H87_002303 [Tephrocybe sp. NHM501043]|nr:hypothetical protein H0H87_002303 [Tephrocybe sp. NHM501043]
MSFPAFLRQTASVFSSSFSTVTSDASLQSATPCHKQPEITIPNDVVTAIINDFADMYTSTEYAHISPTNKLLEDAMRADMAKWNLNSPVLKHTVHMAASLIELSFYNGTFEEKRRNALYNWYIIYIDDASSKNPEPYIAFQHRYLFSLPQLDPVLDAFAAVLHEIEETYPPLQANVALSTTFEFFTATSVESQLAREAPSSGSKNTRFPTFLRERTGLGLTTGVLLFSPSQPTPFVNCYRALPDMAYWISVTNDALSFYKEQSNGEPGYIHARAQAEGRSLSEVLTGLKAEASAASNSAEEALASDPAALKTWRMFQHGYVEWHLISARYRLNELPIRRQTTA